ncbi:echinoidin-like [Mizuhopecten yessoensis]|uniref:Low affinity immunoglobulin epsilon Fc receptor n=1 Tax=Mizuhopecten yessoensis TaxID=6573 RepID=A0A210QTK1_MIZYE|nr:echinoidin-like [Mizuhopecten yessoensis]OWF52078.1 Low affinity immunoglobulin epsilon Fc receptor [Mizuhopecten yessoensis]
MTSLAILILPLLCLQLAAAQTDVSRCPINLKRGPTLQSFEEQCYMFEIHHHRDWAHANNDCVAKGGVLLTLHSSTEQNFIMSTLGSLNFAGNGVWLGLTDQTTEGSFIWADGSPVDYTYWASGQPAGLGGIAAAQEDCTLMKYRDSGHWHDYPCSAVLFFPEDYGWICKFNMLPAATTTQEPVALPKTQAPIVTPTPSESVVV